MDTKERNHQLENLNKMVKERLGMREVFINELGNTIVIEVTKLSEDSYNILIEGPKSSIDSTVTRKEAIVLRGILENTQF